MTAMEAAFFECALWAAKEQMATNNLENRAGPQNVYDFQYKNRKRPHIFD